MNLIPGPKEQACQCPPGTLIYLFPWVMICLYFVITVLYEFCEFVLNPLWKEEGHSLIDKLISKSFSIHLLHLGLPIPSTASASSILQQGEVQHAGKGSGPTWRSWQTTLSPPHTRQHRGLEPDATSGTGQPQPAPQVFLPTSGSGLLLSLLSLSTSQGQGPAPAPSPPRTSLHCGAASWAKLQAQSNVPSTLSLSLHRGPQRHPSLALGPRLPGIPALELPGSGQHKASPETWKQQEGQNQAGVHPRPQQAGPVLHVQPLAHEHAL